jgi:hypothetical protein
MCYYTRCEGSPWAAGHVRSHELSAGNLHFHNWGCRIVYQVPIICGICRCFVMVGVVSVVCVPSLAPSGLGMKPSFSASPIGSGLISPSPRPLSRPSLILTRVADRVRSQYLASVSCVSLPLSPFPPSHRHVAPSARAAAGSPPSELTGNNSSTEKPPSNKKMGDLAERLSSGILLALVCASATITGGYAFLAMMSLLTAQVGMEYWGFIKAKTDRDGRRISPWLAYVTTAVSVSMVISTYLYGKPQIWLAGASSPYQQFFNCVPPQCP